MSGDGPRGTLTFLGASGTVTGSKFLLALGADRLLVDCGLYQGERDWRRLNWDPPPLDPLRLDGVVLTHAHLDHCGYLPALARHGYAGAVHATPATAALAAIVLRDSARLHEEGAAHARAGGYSRHEPPLPLYTGEDAERIIGRFRTHAYTEAFDLAGTTVDLHRAGHILGAASVRVSVGGTSVLFSGDLGRPHHPVLVDRAAPPAASTVVVESTYGDRTHPDADSEHDRLADAIRRTAERGGSVLVPAFAVDRTELVLLTLARLVRAGRIPDLPVHVDSPMALAALDVYRDPAYSAEIRADAFDTLASLGDVRTARTTAESRAIARSRGPAIIISASGMASGGRVVEHLRRMLPDPRHTVAFTGYQALGTRGRALQEGAHEVKIHGRYVRVRAHVVTDGGFSVHADADELLGWLRSIPGPPRTVYVVHGEPGARGRLAERIREELDCAVATPRLGERVVLD